MFCSQIDLLCRITYECKMPRRRTLFYTEILCSLVIGLLIRPGCGGEDVPVRAANLTYPSQPHLLPQGTLWVQIYLTTELCSTLEPDVYKDVKGTEDVSINNAIVATLKCSPICMSSSRLPTLICSKLILTVFYEISQT